MLATALEIPDPVLIFEHIFLYNMEDELTAGLTAVDIDSAKIRRPGATSRCHLRRHPVQAPGSRRTARRDGIEAEVIDLRSLRPLDDETVLESVARTRRAVIVDEGWRSGLAAEIAARIVEQAFYDLDAPVARVCTAEIPLPYAQHLEQAALPNPARIIAAARSVLGRGETT